MQQSSPESVQAGIVEKATLRAAELLGVSQKDLAQVLGVSPSTITRLSQQRASLNEAATERAVFLIRIYRSLMGIVGTDEAAVAWMRGHNHYLEKPPLEAIKGVGGLVRTADYLDAMRAKI